MRSKSDLNFAINSQKLSPISQYFCLIFSHIKMYILCCLESLHNCCSNTIWRKYQWNKISFNSYKIQKMDQSFGFWLRFSSTFWVRPVSHVFKFSCPCVHHFGAIKSRGRFQMWSLFHFRFSKWPLSVICVITLSHFKIDVLLNENYFSKLIGGRLGGEMTNLSWNLQFWTIQHQFAQKR